MDAFQMLKDDHRTVEDLIQRLSATVDPQNKRDLLDELKTEFDIHTEIEEEHLYPALLQFEETSDTVQDGFNEHNTAKDHIKRLQGMDINSPNWKSELELLRSVVQHHVSDEEDKLFPQASTIMSQEQINDLGNRMFEHKQQLQDEAAVAGWGPGGGVEEIGAGDIGEREVGAQGFGFEDIGQGDVIEEENLTEEEVGEGPRRERREWASSARKRGKSVVSDQIKHAAEPVHGIARAVHSTADNLKQQNNPQLSQYAHMAADRIDEIASRLESGDIDVFVGRVSDYARHHPAMFLGGAVAAGFVLSRFFKSSEEHSIRAQRR